MSTFVAVFGEWVGKKQKDLFQYVRMAFDYALEDEPQLSQSQLMEKPLSDANTEIVSRAVAVPEFTTWCARYFEKSLSDAGAELGIDLLTAEVDRKKGALAMTVRLFGSQTEDDSSLLATVFRSVGGSNVSRDRSIQMFEGSPHALYWVHVSFPMNDAAKRAFGKDLDLAANKALSKLSRITSA